MDLQTDNGSEEENILERSDQRLEGERERKELDYFELLLFYYFRLSQGRRSLSMKMMMMMICNLQNISSSEEAGK